MAFFVPIIFGNKRMLQPLKSNDSLCLDVQLETNGKNRQVDITNQFIPNQVSPPKCSEFGLMSTMFPPDVPSMVRSGKENWLQTKSNFYMPLK